MKGCGIFRFFQSDHHTQGSSNRLIFSGNNENFIKNGGILLKERLSLFDGRTNPVRCFSIDDINSMNVVQSGMTRLFYDYHLGVWNGESVFVKQFKGTRFDTDSPSREIAVATQMGNHTNVHRLLGCCLHTDYPLLVYQSAQNGTLDDRIFRYREQNQLPLRWEDRLRIAWEIAHAVAYLHTAFRRPIIHRDLKPLNVFLDQDDSARLSDFSTTVSIPEGKTHVDVCRVSGTFGYIAPDYMQSGRLAESSDVYSFGTLLFVLMTAKPAYTRGQIDLVGWVDDHYTANCIIDIVDPAISTNDIVDGEHLRRQVKELAELALRCTAVDEESRPTMVEVATQLENMISSLSDSL